jgi:Protein of unknown function (DUF1648)
MWLALPFTVLDYWRASDQLPERMAIHFDINWRANGWTSRAGAFELMVGLMTFLLLTFTVAIFVTRRTPGTNFMPWLMLIFFYATIVFVCGVNHWIIRYNLGQPASNTGAQISASSRSGKELGTAN